MEIGRCVYFFIYQNKFIYFIKSTKAVIFTSISYQIIFFKRNFNLVNGYHERRFCNINRYFSREFRLGNLSCSESGWTKEITCQLSRLRSAICCLAGFLFHLPSWDDRGQDVLSYLLFKAHVTLWTNLMLCSLAFQHPISGRNWLHYCPKLNGVTIVIFFAIFQPRYSQLRSSLLLLLKQLISPC